MCTESQNIVVDVYMLEDCVSSRVWRSITMSYNCFLPFVPWFVCTYLYIFFHCYVVVEMKGLCGHHGLAHVAVLERSIVVPRRGKRMRCPLSLNCMLVYVEAFQVHGMNTWERRILFNRTRLSVAFNLIGVTSVKVRLSCTISYCSCLEFMPAKNGRRECESERKLLCRKISRVLCIGIMVEFAKSVTKLSSKGS